MKITYAVHMESKFLHYIISLLMSGGVCVEPSATFEITMKDTHFLKIKIIQNRPK